MCYVFYYDYYHWYRDCAVNTVEENYSGLLRNPNALVAVSKGM